MLSTKEKGTILCIIKRCQRIMAKVSCIAKSDLDEDEDTFEIISFNIFQIGELAKQFDDNFLQKHNGVPWRQIKGMRDKIGHGYDTIDHDRVWYTAQKDIPPLLNYCRKILEEDL